MRKPLENFAIWSLVLFVFASASSGSVLVRQELASIDQFSLEVAGRPFYKEVPSLDAATFNNLVVELVESTALSCGLRIKKESAPKIWITVAEAQTLGEIVALEVMLELREPASLERQWPEQEAKGQLVSVTTWASSRIVLTERKDAEALLLEAMALLFQKFTENVISARQRHFENQIPDTCLDERSYYLDYEEILANYKKTLKLEKKSPTSSAPEG